MIKQCAVCGDDFHTENNQRMYCSYRCASMHTRSVHTGKPIERRNCLSCGKPFYTVGKLRKHCKDCSSLAASGEFSTPKVRSYPAYAPDSARAREANISDTLELARESGLSYGWYRAKKYEECMKVTVPEIFLELQAKKKAGTWEKASRPEHDVRWIER